MQTTTPKPASSNRASIIGIFLPLLFAGVAGVSIYLLSPEGDKLGMTALGIAVTFLGTLMVFQVISRIATELNGNNESDITPRPFMATALYNKDGYFLRLVQEKHYKLAQGEVVHHIDLRHRHETWREQTCMTADRASIKLTPCVIWQVTNPETYMQSARQPDKILELTVLAALTSAIGRRKFDQIAGNIDAVLMEAQGLARARLAYYGITLHAIQVAQITLPEPAKKSDGQKEADFIDTLNKSVPNASALTLQYALRLIELKLAREAGGKKE